MKFYSAPGRNHLEKIKNWLIEEYQSTHQGFFCNWNIIESSFYHDRLFTFEYNNEIIGFLSWTDNDEFVEIDIFEIHPQYRNLNLGSEFYENAEAYFLSKNYKVIKLFCAPAESAKFWEKMKFEKFPVLGYSDHELTYYKPLIEINAPLEGNFDDKLELWDAEPYQVEKMSCRWLWDIKNSEKVIIQPCNPNWNIRLTIDGKIRTESKVKYFHKNLEVPIGNFLILEPDFLKYF